MSISARYWRIIATSQSYVKTWGAYHANVWYLRLFPTSNGTGTKFSVIAAYASSTYNSSYSAYECWNDTHPPWWGTVWYMTSPQWNYADFGTNITPGSLYFKGEWCPTANIDYSNNGTTWSTLRSVSLPNNGETVIFLQNTSSVPLINGFGQSGRLIR